MLAGELYRASDSELQTMTRRARRLSRTYNYETTEEAPERRVEILRELFGAVGEHIEIEPPFFCDYGSHTYIGDKFYMNSGGVVLDCAEVRIGESVFCGPRVQILTAMHPLNGAERSAGAEFAKPVTIGSHVWIGAGSIICPGVTIGDGTTIGAGSVVTRDIPANVLAVGNPCRVLREI